MLIKKRDGDGEMTFSEFAKNHQEHSHCVACSGCIVDPTPHVRFSAPLWCVGCRNKVKASLPTGLEPPWLWETTGEVGVAR